MAGDEFVYSDIVADRFDTDHHQIRIDTDRMLPALDGAIGAMSEPMVSHDCVAFYLLSQEVAKHVKVVQSGQGADEVFAGYHWYPADGRTGGRRRGRRGGALPRRVLRPRRRRRGGPGRRRSGWPTGDPSGQFVTEHFAREGAQTGVDRALRLDTTVMLVDDPVKRVDNMTMAWGLEGRVPFLDHELVELGRHLPAGAQDRPRRQGGAQRGGAAGDSGRGHRPAQGLLPGAGADPSARARTWTWCATRCTRRPPRSADCSGRKRSRRLLADPNGRLTPLRGNELWQIALLELWLQRHGINGSAA